MNVSGKSIAYVANSTRLIAQLTDFNTGQVDLHPEHKAFLLENVYPVLIKGGWVTVLGMASRLGRDQRNKQLSMMRSNATTKFLKTTIPASFGVSQLDGVGEDYAAVLGVRDGNNDGRWRSVLLHAWSRPQPAPLPKQLPQPLRLVPRIVQQEVFAGAKSSFGSEFDGSAGHFAGFGEQIASMMNAEKRVRYVVEKQVPANYAVNQITISYKSASNFAASTGWYIVKFEWGFPKSHVQIKGYGRLRTLTRDKAMPWINKPAARLLRGF